MPSRKLLWISNLDAPAEHEWRTALADFSITQVSDSARAQAVLASERMDCVLITGGERDLSRAESLERLQSLDGSLPVVFWDRAMTAADAVRLIQLGASHCFCEKASFGEVCECLDRMMEDRRRRDKVGLRSSDGREVWRQLLIGESRAMQDVENTIRLVGPRRCTVLITGETGTGKEVAARALHMASPRAHMPMVAVNCSALPENLLEAELFGHVKGAFTGAVNHRIGRFEQANKSTLFLDEIGDMPLELQAKLLRVLQERELQRLGSSETIRLDVRVIAATNVDLLQRVKQKRFREDLYYRLNVVPLTMPPLRKRRSDIPLLVHFFNQKFCSADGIPLKRLSSETLDKLCASPWPGNVRQLENAVEMAVAVSGARTMLRASDFGIKGPAVVRSVPIAFPVKPPEKDMPVNFAAAVNDFERSLVAEALAKASGNKTAAAEMLGLKRTTLMMKLRTMEEIGPLQCVG